MQHAEDWSFAMRLNAHHKVALGLRRLVYVRRPPGSVSQLVSVHHRSWIVCLSHWCTCCTASELHSSSYYSFSASSLLLWFQLFLDVPLNTAAWSFYCKTPPFLWGTILGDHFSKKMWKGSQFWQDKLTKKSLSWWNGSLSWLFIEWIKPFCRNHYLFHLEELLLGN